MVGGIDTGEEGWRADRGLGLGVSSEVFFKGFYTFFTRGFLFFCT